MNRVLLVILFMSAAVLNATGVRGEDAVPQRELISSQLRDQSVAVLRETLARQSRWVKVHAAEYLLELSYPQEIQAAFAAEREAHETEPQYRIGIWRVLARAATSATER